MCVVRAVVSEVPFFFFFFFLSRLVGVALFWLFLVHLIIIAQMLFSQFSSRGGGLLSERVRVWIRNGCCFKSPFLGGVYFGCFWCM